MTVLDDGPQPRVEVAVTVTNSGHAGRRRGGPGVRRRPCRERLPPGAGAARLPARSWLEPGASARVTIELDHRAFAYWHTARGEWIVEGGEFEVRIGASSRDIRLTQTLALSGGDVSAPLHVTSTYGEFLVRSRGRGVAARDR